MSLYKTYKAVESIKEEFPDFKIKYKNEAKGLYKLIFWVAMLFNKNFMVKYTTVLFGNVWFPNREFFEEDDHRSYAILSHEYIHMKDKQKLWILFDLLYLFPQSLSILSVFSFLAFIDIKYLFFLIFVLFLLPFPSIFRRIFEMRAYTMSMFIEYYTYDIIGAETISRIKSKLTNWDYYKISYSDERISEIINDCIKYIKTGKGKSIYTPNKEEMIKWYNK